MTPRRAAELFRVWAAENGLINKDKLAADAPELTADALAQIVPLSNLATNILGHRIVNFVGFNNVLQTVIVFTAKRITKKELPNLPDHIDDVPISYVLGSIGSIGGPPARLVSPPYALHRGLYTCGSSIFVGNRVNAGTLGCIVRAADGVLYGLSNNHVTGNCNFSDPGLPISAPGPIDVAANGVDPFTIGHHARPLPMLDGTPENVPIDQNSDAALFTIKDEALISSMQRGYFDTPSQIGSFVGNMRVEKVGRTTDLTAGIVTAAVVGPQDVYYSIPELGIGKSVYFDAIYAISGLGGRPFSEGGDSGSLVTTEMPDGTRMAVGLVFAGQQSGPTLALPIEPILNAFGVTIVSGHNV